MKHQRLATVDSTLFEAERQIELGASEAMVITAEQQTGGHGRYGRAWDSPAGNVYWTALLPIAPNWPKDPTIALFTALAVSDTLAAAGLPRTCISIKWPNDALVNKKKISGILIKRLAGIAVNGARGYYIVGIGINVEHHPEGTHFPATCLRAELNHVPDCDQIATSLTYHFGVRLRQWQEGLFGLHINEYSSLLYSLNEAIVISFDKDRSGRIEGVNRGVDEAGTLKLELPSGECKLIHVGEIMPF